MEQLYQQVILDHARAPHGRGLVPAVAGTLTSESHQVNPTCGDEVTLRVQLGGTSGGTPVALPRTGGFSLEPSWGVK